MSVAFNAQPAGFYFLEHLRNELDNMLLNQKSAAILNRHIEPFHLNEKNSLGYKLSDYVTKKSVRKDVSINPLKVVGSSHQEYIGKTWLEAIKYGLTGNLRKLKENPQYYIEQIPKEPPILLSALDDKIFVDGDGNHRIALAKLLFLQINSTQLYGVTLTKYEADRYLMDAHCELDYCIKHTTNPRLKMLGISTSIIRDKISETNTLSTPPVITDEEWTLALEVKNEKQNKTLILDDINDILELADEIRRAGFFGRFFKKGKYKSFIY